MESASSDAKLICEIKEKRSLKLYKNEDKMKANHLRSLTGKSANSSLAEYLCTVQGPDVESQGRPKLCHACHFSSAKNRNVPKSVQNSILQTGEQG